MSFRVAILVLILASFILLLDTLVFTHQPANMDGTIHITNMAVFHKAISDGDFPVRWTDGFANYGLPMGSFAQQLTSYLGGFLTFITNNPVTSFNLVYILATLLSVLLFYKFLSYYFKSWPSFIAAFLFNFAPYRIINLYVRGSVPEYFSSIFFVTILIFVHLLLKKKTWGAFLGLSFSVFGMILSHPMNMITGIFFIGPFILYLIFHEKNKLKSLALIAASFLLGVLLSSYYLLPALKEIQYLYYGLGSNHYMPGSTLNWQNFIDTKWYYFITERSEILSRGHFIKTGLTEFIILVIGVIYLILNRFKKLKFGIFDLSVFVGVGILFLTTIYAEPLYYQIDFLSNIQFPWRLLSTFIFIPPIIVAYLLNKASQKWSIILGFLLVILVALNRFPEIYGKNFTNYPQDHYYFTIDNLHTSNMNTVWSGNTTEYPVKRDLKIEILEGEAEISNVLVKNSYRSYNIISSNDVRMIDNTFYFPGWKVYVDNQEMPIEFQDPNYRGVITYWVPKGEYKVEVRFENTKTVSAGNLISLSSIIMIILLTIKRKKLVAF